VYTNNSYTRIRVSLVFLIVQKRFHCSKGIQNQVASGHNKLPFRSVAARFSLTSFPAREHGEHAETDLLRPRVQRPPRPPRAVSQKYKWKRTSAAPAPTSGATRRRAVRHGRFQWGHVIRAYSWSAAGLDRARSLAADQSAPLSTR